MGLLEVHEYSVMTNHCHLLVRAPPVLEFESWSEFVGETAAPGGRLMGPVRASGPTRRSGVFAEGDFGGPQALAAAVGRGSE